MVEKNTLMEDILPSAMRRRCNVKGIAIILDLFVAVVGIGSVFEEIVGIINIIIIVVVLICVSKFRFVF